MSNENFEEKSGELRISSPVFVTFSVMMGMIAFTMLVMQWTM